MPAPVIMWFRRDLRLDGHRALAAAATHGDIVPLFVVDPAFGSWEHPRHRFLLDCLRSLRSATGGALAVRTGDPAEVVPGLARELGVEAVFVTREYTPFGRRRDAEVATRLRADGRRLVGVGSPYAVDPGTVAKQDGTPYAVFGAFRRRWLEALRADDAGVVADPDWSTVRSDPWPDPEPVGSVSEPTFEPGEPAAHDRWAGFRSDALARYATDRDLPALDGTSRLSAHLRFGVVHPVQLLADLDLHDPGHAAFADELAWREFYADVLHHRPDTAWTNLDRRFDRLPVDTDAAARARFERWRTGRTGFPLIDAGMRQLVRTGWMHNRVRMVVASFLVKDLHLPWQWGARHFMDHLVDGDLASNSHGWQWAAGSGTDAAPYFRVFNPTAQLDRFDPDRAYCGRFIPELGTDGYPGEMVDHRAERLDALARYELVKRS